MDSQSCNVQKVLMSLGLKVELIPENQNKKQADLRLTGVSDTTFIEVKSRLADEGAAKVAESAVAGGPVVPYFSEAGKQNHFSGLIQEADVQLSATAGPMDFRVLWFVAGLVPEFVSADERMQVTLFGVRQVFCKKEGENICRPCYYAGFGDFYRYKDLDGVVIQNKDGAVLLANEYSPRTNGFRESTLYKCFAAKNAVREVSKEEQQGNGFYVDGDVNRKDEKKVLKYLRAKYPQIEFLAITDFKIAAAISVIPNRILPK